MKSKLGGLVYSTDAGRMCPQCRQPVADCRCRAAASAAAASQAAASTGLPVDGSLRVSRETKGRAGKGVTLVRGLTLAGDDLTQLARELKAACGSGGTVKDQVIEIQGDHADRVMALLVTKGYKVKRSGG